MSMSNREYHELEGRLLTKLDNYLRFGGEALEDGDCEQAFRAIVRGNGTLGALRGLWMARYGARSRHRDPEGDAKRERLRFARNALRIIEKAYQERCWGGRPILHGLGMGTTKRPRVPKARAPAFFSEKLTDADNLRTRIAHLLQNVRENLDSGDCVETFYSIRDAANYIMYMTAMMKLVARSAGGVITISDKTIEKSVMKFLDPLAALEREFVEDCVKGGEGRARRETLMGYAR